MAVILQPLDLEVGAGTFHPATFLKALGPENWNLPTSSLADGPKTVAMAKPKSPATLLPVPGRDEAITR